MVDQEPPGKKRILVVEDENIVALDIERGLRRLGYDVAGVADNGADAIREAQAQNPDLILMDIRIKGPIDGIEVADRIRRSSNTPVVFLTAYADESTLARATAAGPFGYLMKPFEETDLHTTIQVALKKHKALQEKEAAAQEALFLSEERLKVFVNSVLDYAIFMLNPSGHVISWNAGAERINGYAASEIVGQHVSIFYAVEDQHDGKPERELEIGAREGRFECEGWRVKKGGEKFWASVVLTALRDERGRLLGFGKVTRDLTEKKLAEDALKESEARKAAILEASLDCIVTIDRDGLIIDFNPAAEKTFGLKRVEVIGKEMASLIIPERFRERHRQGLKRYFETGETPILGRRLELPAQRANGSEFPSELSIVSSKTEKAESFTGFLRDITKEKQVLDQLRRAKEDAEAANQAKTEFLANMSHEIRTPLGAVIGFSELLAGQALGPSDRANYISAIKRNGELLANIINDILDLSKVDSGKLDIEKHEVALVDVLADIRAIANLLAAEKGLSFSVSAEGPVPVKINTDTLRLRQILLNIIGNAIKFTDHGSVVVKLHLLKENDGHPKLAFDITDTGTGIKHEQVAKLFAPFTQADASTTRTHGGTGLGLVLSRRLANLLGGDVSLAESAPGRGSTFRVCIDPGPVNQRTLLYQKGEVGGLWVSPPPKEKEPQRKLSGVKILLVEDSIDNQFLVSRILKAVGAVVDTADNGKAAVEKAKCSSYDVLLMDIQMPIMDGYEATAELRRRGCRTPIIALTAHAFKEERTRTLSSGFDDFITKPINREALIESIARFSGVSISQ